MNKLSVVETTNTPHTTAFKPTRSSPRLELEAYYERQWLQNPEQFHPERSARSRTLHNRLLKLLPLTPHKKAVDLGCGHGYVATYLASKGMQAEALDLSRNALKSLSESKIKLHHDYVPHTKLDDGEYELVVASDLIAEIPENDRRLAVSEICRLLTTSGKAVISTPLDIYAEDALIRFILLLETEFEIEQLRFSYHALSIKLPFFKQSNTLLSILESIGHFFWQDDAISHVIAVVRPKTNF